MTSGGSPGDGSPGDGNPSDGSPEVGSPGGENRGGGSPGAGRCEHGIGAFRNGETWMDGSSGCKQCRCDNGNVRCDRINVECPSEAFGVPLPCPADAVIPAQDACHCPRCPSTEGGSPGDGSPGDGNPSDGSPEVGSPGGDSPGGESPGGGSRGGARCEHGIGAFQNGETWMDGSSGCKQCRCDNGNVQCDRINVECPSEAFGVPLPCPADAVIPAQDACHCPRCPSTEGGSPGDGSPGDGNPNDGSPVVGSPGGENPGGGSPGAGRCEHGIGAFRNGEIWMDGSSGCKQCRCDNGNVQCDRINVECPSEAFGVPLPCPADAVIPAQDACHCPRCPSTEGGSPGDGSPGDGNPNDGSPEVGSPGGESPGGESPGGGSPGAARKLNRRRMVFKIGRFSLFYGSCMSVRI
ncbi:kielin/chordin-like protein [Sycon ciliatum]|uniref:kielin/chordin-like protein n=1 Tax=Sycon ciliatum TaxID=27933 RepID=UPI0031F6FCF1